MTSPRLPAPRRRPVGIVGALLWLVATGAAAQEPDGAGPVEAEAPPEAPSPRAWDRRWAWVAVGGRALPAATDVAVSADDPTIVVAVRPDGGVWLSIDGGEAGFEVLAGDRALGATSSDEAALLDVETRVRELLSDVDLSDDGLDFVDPSTLEDEADAAEAAVRDLVDAVQADVLQQGWFGEQSDDEVRVDASPPRIWAPGGERLVVARPDGLHVSRDLGGSWTRAVEGPAGAWAALPDGTEVASVGGRLHRRVDGAWQPVAPPAERVFDLDRDGEGQLLATTDDGLWRSPDGLSWRRWASGRWGFRTLAVARDRSGLVVASSGDGVWRSLDGGRTFVPQEGAPVPGVSDLALTADGRVVAAADDGAWVSVDGGATFTPLRRGLTVPGASAIVPAGSTLFLATPGGLFRLAPEPEAVDARSGAVGPWIPLRQLQLAADARVGVRDRRRLGGRLRAVAAWATPRVVVTGRFQYGRDLTSRLDQGITGRDDTGWQIAAYLEWTPPQRNPVSVDPDRVAVLADDDGRVRVYTGGFDDWMLLGRVTRRGVSTSQRTAEQLGELYAERALLLTETARGEGPRDLRGRVRRALRVEELEAWMDLLTDGAVARYRLGQTTGGGS